MPVWGNRVKIKHLLTEDADHATVQASMNAIADVLDSSPAFVGFGTKAFRNIPQGDDIFGPVDYANRLLDRLYDFADDRRIWIE